jgi:hypothetical protein
LVGPLLLLRLITGSASTCITVQKLGVVKQCPLGTLEGKVMQASGQVGSLCSCSCVVARHRMARFIMKTVRVH